MSSDPDCSERLSCFETETLPHQNALYQSARSLLGSAAEAEDAVQETYLLAWKSFGNFQPGTNCRAWLFSILFNVVRHQRRKWLFRFRLTDDPSVFERTVTALSPTREELLDEEILAALKALPQQYAEVVLLADVQEFSYKEISQATGRPIGTVMSRLSRGRELLRNALSKAAEERGIFKPLPKTAFNASEGTVV
jgi:RNA polymerase sigma-70 factor, ECF subfamily